MTIRFDIPSEVESALQGQYSDLNQAAKEAFLVGLYRNNQLTHRQLGDALGLDRFETDGLLKRHGVDYELTREELDRQIDMLRAGRKS